MLFPNIRIGLLKIRLNKLHKFVIHVTAAHTSTQDVHSNVTPYQGSYKNVWRE